jgi:pyruvate dehydrogenase E2 component (dihydrolipoamide acetyltransferase)
MGTGPGGRISVDDIKAYARQRAAGAPVAEAPRTTREDMSKVRKVTAAHMARCWETVPHVTLNATADVTDLEAIRQQYKKLAEEAGARLTVTAIFVKFVAESLKKHPTLNASIDMEKQQVEYHHFSNIGVAVDTERGLVVPVLRDVETKSILDIAVELTEISAKARSGKLVPDDMRGGTFTVTNLGSLGVEHFTPIVNHPEVAILGMGRARHEAVLIENNFQPRLRFPLSLSFDHRLVDGAEGARFLRTLVAACENPLTMFFESS